MYIILYNGFIAGTCSAINTFNSRLFEGKTLFPIPLGIGKSDLQGGFVYNLPQDQTLHITHVQNIQEITYIETYTQAYQVVEHIQVTPI